MKNQPPVLPAGAVPEVQLRIMGISISKVGADSQARVLILGEVDGPRRMPVVIGRAEAESIAIALEGLVVPRPLTHDLFMTFAQAWGARLRGVFIYKFEDGMYFTELTYEGPEGREVKLDARTSDGIALAVRADVPIFTTKKVIEEVGFIVDDDMRSRKTAAPAEEAKQPASQEPTYDTMPIEKLQQRLADLIRDENYEEASRIRDILRRRQGDNPDA